MFAILSTGKLRWIGLSGSSINLVGISVRLNLRASSSSFSTMRRRLDRRSVIIGSVLVSWLIAVVGYLAVILLTTGRSHTDLGGFLIRLAFVAFYIVVPILAFFCSYHRTLFIFGRRIRFVIAMSETASCGPLLKRMKSVGRTIIFLGLHCVFSVPGDVVRIIRVIDSDRFDGDLVGGGRLWTVAACTIGLLLKSFVYAWHRDVAAGLRSVRLRVDATPTRVAYRRRSRRRTGRRPY
jgi:hypothetical protein